MSSEWVDDRDKVRTEKGDGRWFYDGFPSVELTGKRLAFYNPKSGTETIHIARNSHPPETDDDQTGHPWSICGGGCALHRIDSENAMYLTFNEIVNNNFIAKEGEVIGKICTNCKQSYEKVHI
jgi:hypothetical protein